MQPQGLDGNTDEILIRPVSENHDLPTNCLLMPKLKEALKDNQNLTEAASSKAELSFATGPRKAAEEPRRLPDEDVSTGTQGTRNRNFAVRLPQISALKSGRSDLTNTTLHSGDKEDRQHSRNDPRSSTTPTGAQARAPRGLAGWRNVAVQEPRSRKPETDVANQLYDSKSPEVVSLVTMEGKALKLSPSCLLRGAEGGSDDDLDVSLTPAVVKRSKLTAAHFHRGVRANISFGGPESFPMLAVQVRAAPAPLRPPSNPKVATKIRSR